MLKWIRKLLKKFLPPPVNTFNREVKRILDAVGDSRRSLEMRLAQMEREKQTLTELLAISNQEKQRLIDLLKISKEETQKLSELLTIYENERQVLQNTKQSVDNVARTAREAVWGGIYNNTVCNSEWLTDNAFSPGRWAAGYPYLYVMYRILNEIRPKRILELGLGQSTRMIAQYAAAYKDVEHYVVEHDESWIHFFLNNFHLSERTKIVQLNRKMVPYKEAEAVRVFADFSETFQGMQFDYISIDAPLGGDMKQYARIDVLNILPDCLKRSFVIMIDDYERSGEQHTADEMEALLAANRIAFKAGNYSGAKDLRLWCSPDLAFLCSM